MARLAARSGPSTTMDENARSALPFPLLPARADIAAAFFELLMAATVRNGSGAGKRPATCMSSMRVFAYQCRAFENVILHVAFKIGPGRAASERQDRIQGKGLEEIPMFAR